MTEEEISLAFPDNLEMQRMEPGLRLAEYEVTDSQQEGLTNDVLESCLHGAGYLGRVQLQHFGQDWYS